MTKFKPCSVRKHFAEDNLNVSQNNTFVFHRVGNLVENGENAGYPFITMFSKGIFFLCQKLPVCGKI